MRGSLSQKEKRKKRPGTGQNLFRTSALFDVYVFTCMAVSARNRSIHSWCGSQQSTALPTVVIFWQADYSWGGIFTVVKWGFNGQLSSDKYISAEEREPSYEWETIASNCELKKDENMSGQSLRRLADILYPRTATSSLPKMAVGSLKIKSTVL